MVQAGRRCRGAKDRGGDAGVGKGLLPKVLGEYDFALARLSGPEP